MAAARSGVDGFEERFPQVLLVLKEFLRAYAGQFTAVFILHLNG